MIFIIINIISFYDLTSFRYEKKLPWNKKHEFSMTLCFELLAQCLSLSTTGLKLVSRLLNKILKELIFCRNTTLFLVFIQHADDKLFSQRVWLNSIFLKIRMWSEFISYFAVSGLLFSCEPYGLRRPAEIRFKLPVAHRYLSSIVCGVMG